MAKRILKYGFAAVFLYLIYVVCTGVLPYLHQKTVSGSFADSAASTDYYGSTPCADRVALVEEPLESLGARIHLLDEARETIDLSYYAMHMGPSTDLFLGAILRAADRGVQVRILVDGMSGGLTWANRDYAAALGAHPNIQLKLYNPPNPLKPWTYNGRLHDKYLIIDNRLLLLGGRNIGDKYFNPEGFEKNLSIDRDVLVYNTQWQTGSRESVLFDVRAYLDTLWNSRDVRAPFQRDTPRGAVKRAALRNLLDTARAEYPALFDHSGDDYTAQTFPANRITFLHNGTQIGPKEPRVGYVLGQLLRGARQSVFLQSPYVVLDSALETLLTELGQMGIEYQILTKSLASSPNLPAFAAYLGDREKILSTGAQVWEYQSRHAIHAKTYVIDGRMTVIGSYNLDPRSAYIDTELMLAIDSRDFAAHLRQVQAGYQAQSLELGADGAYLPGQGPAEVPVSLLKRGAVRALSLPIRLFKYLV